VILESTAVDGCTFVTDSVTNQILGLPFLV
jgi:hypothetical protein